LDLRLSEDARIAIFLEDGELVGGNIPEVGAYCVEIFASKKPGYSSLELTISFLGGCLSEKYRDVDEYLDIGGHRFLRCLGI
jgi:hypothetical protein